MTNKLGQVLKETRKKKNMSLREFGEYLGVSHTYLSKLEKSTGLDSANDTSPTIATLIKIADALNITLIDFLYSCGYFEEKALKLDQYDSEQNNSLELKQYIKQIKFDLLSSPNVTYEGNFIDNTDLSMLIAGLEVGAHVILRKK